MKRIRTVMLFVPGDRPDFFPKAAGSGADSIIFDLEDAVSPLKKEAGRRLVERALQEKQFGGKELAVRMNPLATPWGRDDLAMVLRRDAARAREAGFTAKIAISPRQIPVIKAVFLPTADELKQADRIVQAAREAENRGRAVVTVDGSMVDPPVVVRARRLLEMAAEGEKDD